jgi:hypothetical protein
VWCFFYVWFLHDDDQYDLTLTLLFVNGFNIFQGAIQQREKISTSAQKAAKEAEARVSAEILKMKQQLSDKDRELNVSGGWGGGSVVFFFFQSFPYSHTIYSWLCCFWLKIFFFFFFRFDSKNSSFFFVNLLLNNTNYRLPVGQNGSQWVAASGQRQHRRASQIKRFGETKGSVGKGKINDGVGIVEFKR